jgi:hypothetical protein
MNTDPGGSSTLTTPADALLRLQEQRLDVAADRIEQLALVDPVAVWSGEHFLDALLATRQHELLEFPMGVEQHLGRRSLEGYASLGADDGVAEVDAATDAEGSGERSPVLR